VSIRNNITIICFTVLGSEQPLLFYLLYSFLPTKKKKKKKERELLLSTLIEKSVDKFIVLLCIFLVMSCKVAPPSCLIYHVIGFCINQHCR
jgi:hypothetical protein